jgi:hypothetical protein
MRALLCAAIASKLDTILLCTKFSHCKIALQVNGHRYSYLGCERRFEIFHSSHLRTILKCDRRGTARGNGCGCQPILILNEFGATIVETSLKKRTAFSRA